MLLYSFIYTYSIHGLVVFDDISTFSIHAYMTQMLKHDVTTPINSIAVERWQKCHMVRNIIFCSSSLTPQLSQWVEISSQKSQCRELFCCLGIFQMINVSMISVNLTLPLGTKCTNSDRFEWMTSNTIMILNSEEFNVNCSHYMMRVLFNHDCHFLYDLNLVCPYSSALSQYLSRHTYTISLFFLRQRKPVKAVAHSVRSYYQ